MTLYTTGEWKNGIYKNLRFLLYKKVNILKIKDIRQNDGVFHLSKAFIFILKTNFYNSQKKLIFEYYFLQNKFMFYINSKEK